MALAGQSSQDNRPKDEPHLSQGQAGQNGNLLRNHEDCQFVPAMVPNVSQGRVPFVPGRFLFVLDTVLPNMFMFIDFSLA